MGTNYYAKELLCEHCNRYEETHIGKSSGGWVFSLHVDADKGLNSWQDWLAYLKKDNVTILDEYDRECTVAELTNVVTNRGWVGHTYPYTVFGKVYHNFEHLCKEHDAVPGENNLFRHKIGRFCCGHGEGTWDLIEGDFS